MKRAIYIGTLIVCILVINSLLHSIYDLWHKQDLVVKAQNDMKREKSENKSLKKQLTYVQSKEFIEEEARNKLFLVKPGESKILLPQDELEKRMRKRLPQSPNWKQWVDFFIGN